MPEGELTQSTTNTLVQANKKEIVGPPDTPYAGATFDLDIIVVGNLIK